MKTGLLLLLLSLLSFTSYSQTITKSKIYKRGLFSVSEMSDGRILFIYQNPKYQTIIDLVSFSTTNKDSAIFLIDESLRILEMEKTSRDQHIRHKVNKISIVRYGFAQKGIHLYDGESPSLGMNKRLLLKVKQALNNYSYANTANKSMIIQSH